MVSLKFTLLTAMTAGALSTAARPVQHPKRIAQVIADSTSNWVAACTAAGGGQQCGEISVKAFTTLLAAGDPCDHQDAADSMITFGKTLQNNADVISLAQIFTQQPRNAPDSLAVLYCQKAPVNAELGGLFQCQFAGANQAVFTGNVKVGAAGTIPFGLSAPLNPPGSCAANPTGPITDGSQLVNITTNPGVGKTSTGGAPAATEATTAIAAVTTPPVVSTSTALCTGVSDSTATVVASSPTGFKAQNGVDAQNLNKQFSALTASSSCVPNSQACVSSAFAQCVSGKFVLTQCGGGTICAALPLVNQAGTSITCTTASDRDARIAAALAS